MVYSYFGVPIVVVPKCDPSQFLVQIRFDNFGVVFLRTLSLLHCQISNIRDMTFCKRVVSDAFRNPISLSTTCEWILNEYETCDTKQRLAQIDTRTLS